MTTPPYPRALLADHSHYINAVAAHFKRNGLPVQSIEIGRVDDLRTAHITFGVKRDDELLVVGWSDQGGWDWGWADPVDGLLYDGDELFCQPLAPPALVTAALLYDCWPLRRHILTEVPDDEESALAAYAPTVEPEPDEGTDP